MPMPFSYTIQPGLSLHGIVGDFASSLAGNPFGWVGGFGKPLHLDHGCSLIIWPSSESGGAIYRFGKEFELILLNNMKTTFRLGNNLSILLI